MAYVPNSNSVVAFQGNPSVLQVLATITNPNQSVSGAVTVSNFPTNPSISGQVGASVIGHAPVVIVGGSIAASFTPPANQSVSGTVQAELLSSNGSVIVVGSFAPAANQSVSGTVHVDNFSSVIAYQLAGSVLATSATITPAANQSVSGTVNVGNFPATQNVSGSVVATQGTVPWIIGSVYGNVSGSIAGTYANSNTPSTVTGIAMMFKQNVVTSVMTEVSPTFPLPVSVMGLTPVNVTNTNINVSGSVVASGTVTVTGLQGHSVSGTVNVGNFPATQNVSGSVVVFGTVATTQSGTWISSVVNTVPSSMLVGASIIGLTPVSISNTNVNVSGSVVAFISGTPNVNVAGSVIAFQAGTRITSVVNTIPSSMLVGASIIGLTPVSQGGTWTASVFGNMSVIGTVPVTQSGLWQPSALAYVTRNDAVASFLGADLTTRPAMSDSAGRQVVKPFAPEEARIEGYNSVVSGSVTTLIAAAGTGLKNYITDIILVNTGAATTLVTFRSGGGTSVLGYGIAPTGGGSNMIGFTTPLKTLANETFDFQASTSTSVLYAKVLGYKAP